MKKYFAILAVAALTLSAACTKVETVTPDQKISFKAANYVPQTRAGEVSFLNEFAEGTTPSFKSKAYMMGTGVNDVAQPTSPYQDFFGAAGETITWNPTKKEWAPSHDYYWPKFDASYINFFSWYDNNGAPTITNTGKTFTMKWENRVIGTGDNIMYADPAWRFKQNIETYKLNDVQEGVPTLFHHSLAQVEFRAYATKVEVTNLLTWTIKLTDLKLEVANKGTLTLTATEPASGNNAKGVWDGTPAWVADATTKGNIMPTEDFTVTATNAADATTAAKVLANQVVLPQDLSSTNLTFKLDITTTYTAGQTNREVIDVTIPMGATGFGTPAWALNTKYIYTIKIVPAENRVLFDPAVETAWTTVNVAEKTL